MDAILSIIKPCHYIIAIAVSLSLFAFQTIRIARFQKKVQALEFEIQSLRAGKAMDEQELRLLKNQGEED